MTWQLYGRNKFNAIRQTYNGVSYHSRREAQYAAELDLLRKAKRKADRVVDVQRQVRVPLDVNGKHITNYIVDFVVRFGDGREEWIEVKGFATDTFQLKQRLFQALYPERTYRIVK
jgi:uncharacterized protein DUF1064